MRPMYFILTVLAVTAAVAVLRWGPEQESAPAGGAAPLHSVSAPREQAAARDATPTSDRRELGKRLSELTRRPPSRAGADADSAGGLDPDEREAAERRAMEAREAEDLTRDEVRALLEHGFTALPGAKHRSDADYERMTDAVLRVRAARRALNRVEIARASAAVVARERELLIEALADLELASGIPPSELAEAVDADSGLSRDTTEGPDAGNAADENVNELLSDYPPPR